MKKLSVSIVALALFCSASAFNSFPDDEITVAPFFNVSTAKSVSAEKVDAVVTKAFSSKFVNAKDVSWRENAGFYFVDFLVNEKSFKAAYLNDGEFLAISRTVSMDILPMAVLESLSQEYAGYKLPAVVTEIAMQGSTNYYMWVQGKARNLQLKCSADGHITIEKKTKKKILVGSVR